MAREWLNSQVSVGLCALKEGKWWIFSGSSFHPCLFIRIKITLFWWIQQYSLQHFSDVCALIRNVFGTMNDAHFAKYAESAASPMQGRSILLYWACFYCVYMWEKTKTVFPFGGGVPRSVSLSDAQAEQQMRDGKRLHAILLFSRLELAQGQSIVMPTLYKLFINFCPCLLLLK